MAKVKKIYRKKEVLKSAFIAVFLMLLCASLSYFLLTTNILKPTINEMTASYISFNNSNTTDMLKITSLKKMNNTKGISYKNNSYVTFQVDGSKKSNFNIVLYHLGNTIDDSYIRFALYEDSIEIAKDILSNMEETNDDGKIIYTSSVKKNSQYTIKMWIDKSYEGNPNNISYEVKIK